MKAATKTSSVSMLFAIINENETRCKILSKLNSYYLLLQATPTS